MDVDLGQLNKPCVCGRVHEASVKALYVEPGAVTKLTDILEDFQNPVFICDRNTRTAAEPFLEEEFKDYPVIELNPDGLAADQSCIDKMMMQLDACDRGLSSVSVDVLVAIGGGTIHDLTRFAANEYGIPFVSIPTAASSAAYASATAAIIKNGVRQSVQAVAPSWILADTSIFAKAPYRLTVSGISDLLSKYIALLDWKVANLIGGEYICDDLWDMQEKAIKDVERLLEDISSRDAGATEKLMYALIMSGLNTQLCGCMAIYSGSEFFSAQLWENAIVPTSKPVSHGDAIAVAFLMVLDFYKKLGKSIRKGNISLETEVAKGLEIGLLERTFSEKGLLENILVENTPNPLDNIDLEKLEDTLPQIRDLIDELPDSHILKNRMKAAGCKVSLHDIGLTKEDGELTLSLAPYVKNQLTLLRLSKLLHWH